MRKFVCLLLWGLIIGSFPLAGTCATTITFDEFPAGNNNVPITNLYNSLGVTFGSDNSGIWGGNSNGDPGDWRLNGTNGPQFLGNNGTNNSFTWVTNIFFSAPVFGVSFDASRSNGSSPGQTMTVSAYAGTTLLSVTTVLLGDINQWATIRFDLGGIDRIVILGSNAGFSPYGIDNLQFGNVCQVNVTLLGQGDPRWNPPLYTVPYDHSTSLTIANKGCALTSLSMGLNDAGVTNDPGSLNYFMAHTETDYNGLSVNWGPATRDVSGGTLKFHSTRINSVSNLQAATQYLDNAVCQQGHPVVVGVELDAQGTPGHFVLVTGKEGDDFQIADPGFRERTRLSQYNNQFETRGFVADSPGDISEMDSALGGVAELMVISPSGLRTGFDPNTGHVVEQIPQSVYFRDALADDVTGEPPTETGHLSEVFQPSQGAYKVVITGLKVGEYALSTRIFSQDGSSQPELAVAGVTGAGSTSSFSLQVTSSPGTTSSVLRLATFQSTLADVSNSLQLGLIDNQGIANSLSQKIQGAASATGPARANILGALKNEVNAQAGIHITGVAVRVLLEDVDSLLRQDH